MKYQVHDYENKNVILGEIELEVESQPRTLSSPGKTVLKEENLEGKLIYFGFISPSQEISHLVDGTYLHILNKPKTKTILTLYPIEEKKKAKKPKNLGVDDFFPAPTTSQILTWTATTTPRSTLTSSTTSADSLWYSDQTSQTEPRLGRFINRGIEDDEDNL